MLVSFLLCLTAFSQADKAKYYIEGDYAIRRDANNRFVYTLSNISSKGIYFANADSITGQVEEDESISSSCETCSPPGRVEQAPTSIIVPPSATICRTRSTFAILSSHLA